MTFCVMTWRARNQRTSVGLLCPRVGPLVEVKDLLHELVGGEGHSLGRHTAYVVERQASVKSLLHPVAVVDILQGLAQCAVLETGWEGKRKYIWK